MSRKASPTVIGAFVVGSAALAAAGALVLGSGDLLREKGTFVMYFPGPVGGLQTGAPVNFRGVRIGSVTDVRVELDVRDSSVRTPVFVEIEPRRISEIGALPGAAENSGRPTERTLELLVAERGLRAWLRTVSFVTGQVVVELDFFPESEIRLVGVDSRYPELPTVSSTFDELTDTIARLPIEDLMESLLGTVRSLEDLLAAPEFEETPHKLNETLEVLGELARKLGAGVEPLTVSLERTSGKADATFDELEGLLRRTDARLASLTTELEATSQAAQQTLGQAEETLAGLSGGQAELQYQLTLTLGEISDAARALRLMAETLEQHPEAVLRGKREGG